MTLPRLMNLNVYYILRCVLTSPRLGLRTRTPLHPSVSTTAHSHKKDHIACSRGVPLVSWLMKREGCSLVIEQENTPNIAAFTKAVKQFKNDSSVPYSRTQQQHVFNHFLSEHLRPRRKLFSKFYYKLFNDFE